MSKCYWKNGTKRLAYHRVAASLQFKKNTVTAKQNEAKHNKTRYACTARCHVIENSPTFFCSLNIDRHRANRKKNHLYPFPLPIYQAISMKGFRI